MALLRVEYSSRVLEMNTSFQVFLPDEGNLSKTRVVYLLHGLTDNCTGWTRYTACERYARTVLGISQLFHSLGMRDVEKSVFCMRHFENKLMMAAFVIGFTLQLLVTEVPYFIQMFGTCPLSMREWGMLILLSAMPVLAHEIMLFSPANFLKREKRLL